MMCLAMFTATYARAVMLGLNKKSGLFTSVKRCRGGVSAPSNDGIA
jgi:hypothetical protein